MRLEQDFPQPGSMLCTTYQNYEKKHETFFTFSVVQIFEPNLLKDSGADIKVGI